MTFEVFLLVMDEDGHRKWTHDGTVVAASHKDALDQFLENTDLPANIEDTDTLMASAHQSFDEPTNEEADIAANLKAEAEAMHQPMTRELCIRKASECEARGEYTAAELWRKEADQL